MSLTHYGGLRVTTTTFEPEQNSNYSHYSERNDHRFIPSLNDERRCGARHSSRQSLSHVARDPGQRITSAIQAILTLLASCLSHVRWT